MNQENNRSLLVEKLQRRLPINKEAEQILLGAILTNDESLEYVDEFLKSEHFYEILHQKIYRAMQTIKSKELSCDLITVKSVLNEDLLYQENGGDEYLYKLPTITMAAVNVTQYGRIIYDAFLKRSLIDIGEELVNKVYDSTLSESALEQIEAAAEKIDRLAENRRVGKGAVKINTAENLVKINQAIKNRGKLRGISTGFKDLDEKLNGFQESNLIILAGRPSIGKTAFALNFAYNACLDLIKSSKETGSRQKSVGFLSLEMSKKQLITRLLSMMTAINMRKLRNGDISEEEYNILSEADMKLSSMPLFIADSECFSLTEVRAKAFRLKRKHNLGILFIDYLQLMECNSTKDNRVSEITEITRSLKLIAKDLNIPIVVLSQLSRAVEQRSDKRPILSDLRESGSIEQDADIVTLLYREEYYLRQQEPLESDQQKYQEWAEKIENNSGVAELIIAKHRNGETGNIKLYYDTSNSVIKNYASNNKI